MNSLQEEMAASSSSFAAQQQPSSSKPCIMTFRPTWDEFRDFNAYISHIESRGGHLAGVCKVIPPPEWKPRRNPCTDEFLGNMKIPVPIKQAIVNQPQQQHGVYEMTNYIQEEMTVAEYRAQSLAVFSPVVESWDNEAQYKTAIERAFWKALCFQPATYGADVNIAISDPDCAVWNINKLGTLLDKVLSAQDIAIGGVNTAYTYFGQWKAAFAWHTEDQDLYSLNYIHYGAPKFWYAIPPEYADRFTALLHQTYTAEAKVCRAFMRHKRYLLSPTILKKHNIPYDTMLHKEGEIMITFPKGYHAGFNCGFNIAESANFASERWIELGIKATRCFCVDDTVQIDMSSFLRTYNEEFGGNITIPDNLDEELDKEEEKAIAALDKYDVDPEIYAVLSDESDAAEELVERANRNDDDYVPFNKRARVPSDATNSGGSDGIDQKIRRKSKTTNRKERSTSLNRRKSNSQQRPSGSQKQQHATSSSSQSADKVKEESKTKTAGGGARRGGRMGAFLTAKEEEIDISNDNKRASANNVMVIDNKKSSTTVPRGRMTAFAVPPTMRKVGRMAAFAVKEKVAATIDADVVGTASSGRTKRPANRSPRSRSTSRPRKSTTSSSQPQQQVNASVETAADGFIEFATPVSEQQKVDSFKASSRAKALYSKEQCQLPTGFLRYDYGSCFYEAKKLAIAGRALEMVGSPPSEFDGARMIVPSPPTLNKPLVLERSEACNAIVNDNDADDDDDDDDADMTTTTYAYCDIDAESGDLMITRTSLLPFFKSPVAAGSDDDDDDDNVVHVERSTPAAATNCSNSSRNNSKSRKRPSPTCSSKRNLIMSPTPNLRRSRANKLRRKRLLSSSEVRQAAAANELVITGEMRLSVPPPPPTATPSPAENLTAAAAADYSIDDTDNDDKKATSVLQQQPTVPDDFKEITRVTISLANDCSSSSNKREKTAEGLLVMPPDATVAVDADGLSSKNIINKNLNRNSNGFSSLPSSSSVVEDAEFALLATAHNARIVATLRQQQHHPKQTFTALGSSKQNSAANQLLRKEKMKLFLSAPSQSKLLYSVR